MMYAQDKQHVPDRVELKGILSEFRDALEEEIDKIKKAVSLPRYSLAGAKSKAMVPTSGIALMLNMSPLFRQICPVSW